MNTLSGAALRRWIVGWVVAAMLLPTLQGCAGAGAPARGPHLAGIVVDDRRLAEPGERGLVRVVRVGRVLDAAAGMALLPGDRLELGPRAHVAIHYPNGNSLLLRAGSSGELGSLRRLVGEAFARVRGRFAIETVFVRAAVEGTVFAVRTATGGETVVTVLEGRVRCEPLAAGWPAVSVDAGELAVAHPRPAVKQPAPPSELEHIQSWVGRVEQLVPAPPASNATSARWVVPAVAALIGAILLTRRDKGAPPARGDAQRPLPPPTDRVAAPPQAPPPPPPPPPSSNVR